MNDNERSRNDRWLWLAATTGLSFILALVPLRWHPRFYFHDDTENGAYGVWYHLGQSLIAGKLPILNPTVWSSGNYTAEMQWGTWNPLTMLIGVVVYMASDAVVVSSAIKISFLVVAAMGCHLLARSYFVPPALAFVVGIAVPLNGFTMFFDAPSWVTGQITWALLPFFWLNLRSLVNQGRNPIWSFVIGYLIVTVGYVAGTVAVGFVLLAVGMDALFRRNWANAMKVANVGLSLILVSVVVYLPGVMTAAVTNRSGAGITNDEHMGVDLSGLVSSTISTAFPLMPSWWWSGYSAPAPAVYVAWFLPMAAFMSWKLIRPYLHEVRDLLIFAVLALLFVLLPTTVGPLRYPVRFMPYVALAAVLLCIVLFAHARAKKPSKLGLLGALGAVCFGVFGAWAQVPSRALEVGIAGLIAGVGLLLLWSILRGQGQRIWKWSSLSLIAVVVATTTVAATIVQHRSTNGSPLSASNMPAETAIPKSVLAGVENDVIVVGDPLDYPQDNSTWSRTLMANTWYLSPASVQNRYQLLGYSPYNLTTCLRYLGGTCPELLNALFETRSETGLLLADELAVDNIQILKKSFQEQQPKASNWFVSREHAIDIRPVPEGWHVVSDDGEIALWSRDEPVGPAGGLVWESDGTRATEISRSDREVRFRVESVPETGGKIALSRLAWPGYRAEGAELSEPVDGFLLAFDIPASSKGDIVSVSFHPPGWDFGIKVWITGVGLMLFWAAYSFYLGISRRHRSRGGEVLSPREKVGAM